MPLQGAEFPRDAAHTAASLVPPGPLPDGFDELLGVGVRVQLVSGFAVVVGGQPVELSVAPARLVALLSLEDGPPRSRSFVAGTLWPELGEDRAMGNLRSALWRLRQRCPSLVTSTVSTLNLGVGVDVDLHRLNRWIRAMLDPVSTPRVVGLPSLVGVPDLLPGWDEDWLMRARDRLATSYVHALENLVDELLVVGRYGEADLAAEAAIDADPWRESAWRAGIAVQLALGNVVCALRRYERCCYRLAEFGVRPSAQLRALVRGLSES